MPVDNKSGIGTKKDLPTPAWDDIAQNSFADGKARVIYEQAAVLWIFYYQIYNGGFTGWISNNHFFHIHDVRDILQKIGGTATLEIEKILVQILPYLDFQFDPLMEPDNPLFHHQSCIKRDKRTDWEIAEKDFDERVFALKQEFRREGEEYFAFNWNNFNSRP